MIYRETPTRAAIKATTWRFFGTLATAILVWIVTGRWQVALAVGGIEAVSKIALYYFHERIWNKISYGRKPVPSMVIWFTGLSGAGKTTVADLVGDDLQKRGYKIERLDGDLIRKVFPQTGFTREERNEHVKRVGFLASRLEQHGVIALVSLISPYAESRDFVRGLCSNFFEIHVSTPYDVCEKRDTKGLYAKARSGELRGFTGKDAPYEAPLKAELVVDASGVTPEKTAQIVLKKLKKLL